MKRNMKKIPAILVTLIMIASAIVVLNSTTPIVSAAYSVATTPGVDRFECGNETVGDDVLNTSLSNLKYGYTGTITANGSANWESVKYYLWYPKYSGDGIATTYSLTWARYTATTEGYADPSIEPSTDLIFGDGSEQVPTLNRSGLWLIGPIGMVPDAHDLAAMNSTIPAWFWVNTSTVWAIDGCSDFEYDGSGSLSISVKEGSTAKASMLAIFAQSTGRCIWSSNVNLPEGTKTVYENNSFFTIADTYTVIAYWDSDIPTLNKYYDDDAGYAAYFRYWNDTYGNKTVFATQAIYYNYDLCGPWDPPEFNATSTEIAVTARKPHISLTNATAVYWGLKKRIDVNVTADDGTGITGGTILLRETSGSIYYNGTGTGSEGGIPLTKVWINDTGKGNYSIEIPRIIPGDNYNWSILANHSWYVYFVKDENSDGVEEWNTTGTSDNKFKITGTNPPVQLIITSDGDGALDNKVNVPAYTDVGNGNPATTPTVDIEFSIYGTSISDDQDRAYYGDAADGHEDWKNITVSGDILYPVDGTTLTNVGGDWTATVTPTKPGGTITITIDWPGSNNGTATETIDIINGSSVVCSVESFTIGTETTLTFTVTDKEGTLAPTANVYLWWEGGNQFNLTPGDGKIGNGKEGIYSRIITTTDQGTSAPKNMTVGVKDKNYGLWGYTTVRMDKNHNMNVTITPTTSYAGDPTEYDIAVGLLSGGHPVVDSPSDLHVMIYDENGDPVTDGAIVSGTWPIDKQYSITDREIILAGGIYQIYAYNDSHDSQGHNATITVTKYIVESSPEVLAWLIDTDVNITFQLTPAGNGTLTLDNISSMEVAVAGTDTVDIENGIGTIEGLDATTLGNITFSYQPQSGEDRPADAKDGKILKVTTATAIPIPATIYLGEPTTVTITVTHPAAPYAALEDIRIGLDHGLNLSTTILSKLPTDAFTDANGQVQFAITADASGEITIYIENGTDPDNEFVIKAEARKTMKITTSVPAVNEGETFTVEAKSGGVLITDATVIITFAGNTSTTETGTKTLTAPAVKASLDYMITATADGYSDDTATIKVLDVPKLTIILPSGKVYGTKEFTVTVADDTGSAVVGAKVTFNGADYYTGAGGSLTLTAPDVKETSKDYTLTAAFTGFESSAEKTLTIYKTQGGIPGFELVTLIAAIGVALILLRRRRN
ncbi:MAG: hypothetical protein NTV74_04960 [Euryarchaeota archaeon]|nr:hypothetical protein [Euryarchaeota archaeon]